MLNKYNIIWKYVDFSHEEMVGKCCMPNSQPTEGDLLLTADISRGRLR